MPTALEMAGASPRNQSLGRPIHIARMETGLFTNRSPLHDPAQYFISKFYGGYIDALIDGLNMEVSNALTVIRRPGNSVWSSFLVPNPPLWFYDWRKLDGTVHVITDTSVGSYDTTTSTGTQIFTKTGGAAQGYYVGVGNVLYYGDGVETLAYNGSTYNWGIVAPTNAPVVQTVSTAAGSAAGTSSWFPSVTYSTMGFIVANAIGTSTPYVYQLTAVNNPSGVPSTTIGTTGTGQPAWNQVPGGLTVDNAFNWTNWGPIVLWQAGATYRNASIAPSGPSDFPCIIYDPKTSPSATQCCFINSTAITTPRVAGNTYPKLSATFGSSVGDGQVEWFNCGSLKTPQPWIPSHVYSTLGSVSHDVTNNGICEPNSLANGLPASSTTYWQVNATGANITSGSGGTQPPFSATNGTGVPDNQLTWTNISAATWVGGATYNAWTQPGNYQFSAIKDSNGNIQVCVQTGTSNPSTQPTWHTGYGQHTSEISPGTAIWTCVGVATSWAANTKWYLPSSGFFAPFGSVQFGGAAITDSNQNVEFCINSGISGAGPAQPTWNSPGKTTTDNTVTWYNQGAATQFPGSLAWTKGYEYAYSYYARPSTDQYNTKNPPDWNAPLGPPTGSQSAQISTASPIATVAGPNPGAVNILTMTGSTDPQVDTIIIWRTLDGGSTLLYLTEVPNPAPTGNPAVGGTITVTDYQPDSVLNELIPAPINATNNPPPTGFKPMCYHFGRVWGAVGNFVYCSGGGDVVTGNGNESFNPSEFFEFPSPVTRIVPTATGIEVFLTSDVYAIQGGPAFVTFYPMPLIPGVGLMHYNALDIHGGVIYLYTADNQFLAIDPSGGVNRLGQAIADKLQAWNNTKVFVTVHENGNDNCIVISDGSTGWYRLNPSQFPNGSPVWSPLAQIVGGAGAVLSMEVSPGIHRLLIGGTGNNQPILQRDFTTNQDNGASYSCFATMGSINLCAPGQIAGCTFVNLRCTKTGTTPTVSFLLNEVSGSFTNFPAAQPYPWQIYGQTSAPVSLYSNAYYFMATTVPALAEHLQVKWTFPVENFQNEVLSLTVYGVIEQAPEG